MKYNAMKKNGFRLLSDSEVERVSGGFDGILVIGGVIEEPISILGGGHGFGGSGIENPGAGSEHVMLGPGGGGFDIPEECFDHSDSEEQSEEQRAAEELGEDIFSDDEYSDRELGGIIYVDGEKSGVLEGQASSISLGEFAREVDRADREWSEVEGLIHTHPSSLYANEDQFNIARYPTDADWRAAESAIALGANPNDLSLFIIGPDDIIREFKYADRDSYTLPYIDPNLPIEEQLAILDAYDQSRVDGENLPDGTTLGDSPC